jgi:hypothetical protein
VEFVFKMLGISTPKIISPLFLVTGASYYRRQQMRFLHFKSILKMFIDKCEMNGLNKRKINL